MKSFTDLFIRRPVLALVVNLVILIAGFQAIRSLNVRQYPRSDNAAITVTTAYVGASADLVRGFITQPLERVIAAADGIDYIESSSALGVYTYGHDPISIADGMSVPADPSCPTIADDGTTMTITGGGCLDPEGVEWNGSVTVVRGSTGGKNVTLTGFDKAEDPDLSAPVTGSFALSPRGGNLYGFVVDVMVDGGIDNHTVYDGTVAGGYVGPTRAGPVCIARPGGARREAPAGVAPTVGPRAWRSRMAINERLD